MEKLLSLGLILGVCGSLIAGCSSTEISNNKKSKQEILDSYDEEEDIKYDIDLLADVSNIEHEMFDKLEGLQTKFNDTEDKATLVEECEKYKEVFKNNIETIKTLAKKTKTQETSELIQMLEEQAKIDYCQLSDLSELKYDDANSWNEIYNQKADVYRKRLKEVTKKYNEILGIDESELEQ